MYINLRNCLIFGSLLGTTLLSWYLSRPATEIEVASEPSERAPLGYYLRDAVLFGTDEHGALLYRIVAEGVEQSTEQQGLELRQVRVEYQEKLDIQWALSAESAIMTDDR